VRTGAWQTHAPELELVIGGSADTLWERILERTRTMLALREAAALSSSAGTRS
jgi:hypothetical protein